MAKLLVCCDGTWNDVADRTHIHRIADAGKRLDDDALRVFYDEGVGTERLSRLSGGALGRGLSKNIRQAYAWLARAWRPDDQVFIFGFSRGAYTVRSLCGLITFAGLLHADDVERAERDGEDLVKKAYKAYRHKKRDPARAERFRSRAAFARTRHPSLRFLGVFDTVGALGVPVNWMQSIVNGLPFAPLNVEFHDTDLCAGLEVARQALAIDERRGPFRPTFWTGDPTPGQDVKQVWFAGVHSDVGGGYPDKRLAEVPLAWMLNEAAKAGLDLRPGFEDDPLDPDPAGPMHDSMGRKYLLMHRLLPSIDPHLRPIGPAQRRVDREAENVPGERLHASVLERIEGLTPAYRPPQLVGPDGVWRPGVRDLPVEVG